MGELTASENTFIAVSKLVGLPSFNLLNFLRTSSSSCTHIYTRSVSGQTHTRQLCTISFHARTHIHTHTYIYKYHLTTFPPFVLTVTTHTHKYVRVTLATIHLPFILNTPTHKCICITNIYEHCYFVLTFPCLFCFIRIFVLTFLL